VVRTLINLVPNAIEAMDGVTDRAKSLVLRCTAPRRGAQAILADEYRRTS